MFNINSIKNTFAALPFALIGATSNALDIVDTAVSAGQFNTLVAAVEAADLATTLKGDGPFTVFAPTDDAFAALPPGTVEGFTVEQLSSVLTYHVVEGIVDSAAVVGLSSAATVNGESVTIDTTSGVVVDNANVVVTDIIARNGIIHVIDGVLVPAGL